MTRPWPTPLMVFFGHGPVVAGLAAAAIAPGMHAFLALFLERRLVRPRKEFTAVAFGDPLLCVACCLGVALAPKGACGIMAFIASLVALITSSAGWLSYGLVQWRSELRTGFYTSAQAFSPTKVWHQLIVYPVFGTMVMLPALAGVATPLGGRPVRHLIMKLFILGCATAWGLMNVYDRRHPRLGHPPFDWRRIQPCPEPWPAESVTLRTWAGS